MTVLDIYNYTSASRFLKDCWHEKNKKNPSFSLRAWARNLGFKSHSPLHLMLAGKRSIPKKYVPAFVEYFDFSSKEEIYFESLIELERAGDPAKKEFYLKRLRGLSPRPPVRMVEVEHFTCLRDPLHIIIMEMTALKGFKPEPKWIQSRVSYKVSLNDIEEAIDRLIGLGLLKENADGSLARTHAHITNRADIADRAVQEYHGNVSKLAAESVFAQALSEREYNAYSLNIKKSRMPRAKEMIREFVKRFIREVEAAPSEGEETYHLNVQFFGLTGTKNKLQKIKHNKSQKEVLL